MICYFREGLKPSIKVEMEQQDRESMDFEEMVQRAVNAEAKADLRSSTMVRDLDARCPKGHRPFHNTSSKVKTQGSNDSSRFEEPKPKNPKPAVSRNNAAEPAKKENRKDKKKKLQNRRQEQNKQTPTTGDNIEAPKKKRRGVTQARSRVLTVIRKAIMPATAPSLQKTSVGVGNLRADNQ